MVFRACLGSSLGLIIGLTISFFMVEVVNGKHVKNPLQRMQLKQKQRNNMILKRYKSQKSFLVPKCFIFWKFESFSKKASISRFPTWIFWKNHRETTSRKSAGKQHRPNVPVSLTGLVWRPSPRSFTSSGFAAPRRRKSWNRWTVKDLRIKLNSKDWKVSRNNFRSDHPKSWNWRLASLTDIFVYII